MNKSTARMTFVEGGRVKEEPAETAGATAGKEVEERDGTGRMVDDGGGGVNRMGEARVRRMIG